MTATSTASTAGDDKTAADGGRKECEHGMARAREEECYHLTNLIRDCLDEAGHLVGKVNAEVTARYADWSGAENSQPLDYAEIGRIVAEAHDCASMALGYFRSLADSVAVSVPRGDDPYPDEEPPF